MMLLLAARHEFASAAVDGSSTQHASSRIRAFWVTHDLEQLSMQPATTIVLDIREVGFSGARH
jgi:hypothetical protein